MQIHRRVRIECPPSILWRCLVEPDLIKKWDRYFLDETPEDPSQQGVGSYSVVRMQVGNRIEIYRCRLIEWVPEQRLSYGVQGSSFDEKLEWELRYSLAPEASDTMLDCDVFFPLQQYNFMAVIIGPMIWMIARSNLKRELAALSALAPMVYAGREERGSW